MFYRYQAQYGVPLTFPQHAMPMVPAIKPLAENITPVLPTTKPAAEKIVPVSPATTAFAENIAPGSSRFNARIKIGNPSFTGFVKPTSGEESHALGLPIDPKGLGCDGEEYYHEASLSEASATPSRPSHPINAKGEIVT